jgi:hypothetical protein
MLDVKLLGFMMDAQSSKFNPFKPTIGHICPLEFFHNYHDLLIMEIDRLKTNILIILTKAT